MAIKVGVIGNGYWGPNLIRNFMELPEAELVGVADLQEDRLKAIQKRHPGLSVTTNYRDLFVMGVDAVVIATPPHTHYPIARDCLMHDIHVLVEKPLTLNSVDAQDLIELAEARNLTLMVGHTFEYNDAVRTLKRLIDSGELGKIHYIDAVRANLGLYNRRLNVLWDLAPHDISILLYLLGKQNIAVNAHGIDSVFDGVQDVVNINMYFDQETMAHVRVSWLDPCKTRRITVVGSRKMVVYDDIENLEKIKIYDKGVDVLPHTETYGDFQCSYRYGDVTIPHFSFSEPLKQECKHFLDCILSGETPCSDGVSGLNVVKVLEAADASMQQSGMKCVAYLNGEPLLERVVG
jgi:predicted dehydrogenase